MIYLVISNTAVLLLLAMVHFYWLVGGEKWVNKVIPEKYKTIYFDPKNKVLISAATLCVALSLIGLSLVVLSSYYRILTFLTDHLIIRLTQVIAFIFLIRAIGDFNDFGLFKKKSKNLFCKYDTIIYVPLCLFIGTSLLIISILQKT